MSSLNLSENYYLRKCLLAKDQVPTQTQMLQKMQPPLGKVYFGSMTHKLKVIAGFEPPMQGGGTDWYMPPDELLKGRAVLKPIKHEYISKLGYKGIEYYADRIIKDYHLSLAKERARKLEENDREWKNRITEICYLLWAELSLKAAQRNTQLIVEAFQQYTSLYATNVNRIEHILLQAARKEIEDNREKAYQKMMLHYETLLKDQARMLYSRYTKTLEKHKTDRKNKFIAEVEELRMDLGNQYHKINYEKHLTIEKLRAYMECQNLACQVYVAMKEQQEHEKEVSVIQERHEKKMKGFKKEITKADFEIKIEQKLDDGRQELNRIWRKKICKVVKSFQDFIGYCLSAMPEHAEFFLDIEKLLLLQLDEAFENPSAESIIVTEDGYKTPVARPHPYYLVCDKGFKPNIDADLCPEHCTSSASQLPVIVVNKRCIYSACDNVTLFADKLEDFIKGKRGDDSDLEDDHSYTNDIPIKYSKSQNIMELQLESSIMQIIQKEKPNLKDLPVYCCDCHLPHCYLLTEEQAKFCPVRAKSGTGNKVYSFALIPESPQSMERVSRNIELEHEREPKIASYLNFVHPEVCKCYKLAKKHLKEHLPPYMVNMSAFEPPELPQYEMCSMETLRTLVREARGISQTIKPDTVAIEECDVKDASTQCEDEYFEFLCTCFSDAALEKFFTDLAKERMEQDTKITCKIVDNDMKSSKSLEKTPSLFVMEQALKLRKIVECPQIQEIFKRPDCQFEKNSL